MSQNFKLSDLIPDPLTFTDDSFGGDGTTHDVKTAAMLSPDEFAQIERIKADLDAFYKTPEGGTAAGLRLFEQRADEFLTLLIPGLPPARLSVIPVAFKLGFLGWWQRQQPQVPAGKAMARAQKTPRGRSRASSTPTE